MICRPISLYIFFAYSVIIVFELEKQLGNTIYVETQKAVAKMFFVEHFFVNFFISELEVPGT